MYQTESAQDLLTEEFLPVYGGFWERFAAAIIDGIILYIPVALLQYSMGGAAQEISTKMLWQNVIALAIQWLYFATMESGDNQATFGKKALGLKVTDLQGERITFAKATGRYFGKFISAIIFFIGYLMMLWSPKKQTLHDVMAGTLIIKNN